MKKLQDHVLAAYYSDARLNIHLCLNDIREKIGRRPIPNEDQIVGSFKEFSLTSLEPEKQERLIRFLRKRFPFVDVQVEGGKKGAPTPLPKYFDNLLLDLFKSINLLRNSFIHPAEPEAQLDYPLQKALFFALGKTFDAALNTVITRFQLDAIKLEDLRRSDGNGVKDVDCFPLALCKAPDKEKKTTLTQSDFLYDFGRILLCSIFLDKSQSAELVSHFWASHHGNKCRTDRQPIIRELLSVYRIRLPLSRLQTDDSLTTVTLDSLSELSRCPRQLFDALGPQDQQRFRTGNSPGGTDSNKEEEENSTLMRRGMSNRFPSLIMRFLDFESSCKLRFAIDCGQFYYNVRLKPPTGFVDQRARVRRLGKKIIGYGRLHEFTDNSKPAPWKKLEQNYLDSLKEEELHNRSVTDKVEQLTPYIVPCKPHYHYADDRIGFRLASENENRAKWPDLRVSEEKASNAVCLDPPKGRAMEPDFWISHRQLLHLAFYIHLQGNTPGPRSIESMLKRYRNGMAVLFKAIRERKHPRTGEARSEQRREAVTKWLDSIFNGHNNALFTVTLADLPRVVGRFLMGVEPAKYSGQDIAQRVKRMVDKTETLYNDIKYLARKDTKPGKKNYRPIKCGQIADFLTDDLLRFQPVDPAHSDGGKLNSQHYQILQAALAYYGAHLDEPPRIVDLLDNAGLLSGDQAHPFLYRLITRDQPGRYRNLIEFYKQYLLERKEYLNCYARVVQGDKAKVDKPASWLRMRQHATIDTWLAEQMDKDDHFKQPLPLARNFFYHPLLMLVAEKIGIDPGELEREGTQTVIRKGKQVKVRPATNWLIQRYLNHIGEKSQEMYTLPRRHDLFDGHLDKRTGGRYAPKNSHYLTEKERKDLFPAIRQEIAAKLRTRLEKEKDRKERLEQQKKSGLTKKKKNQVTRQIRQVKQEIDYLERQIEKRPKQLKHYKRSELRIRHQAVQDMVLYLFTKANLHSLQLTEGQAPDWSLKTLGHTLLSTKVHFELPVKNTSRCLVHPECKIKNLGELRLLVLDRRLPTLLDYYPPDESIIDQAEIRAELSSYRRCRVKVMALIHKLENAVARTNMQISRDSIPRELKDIFGGGRHSGILFAIYRHFQENSYSSTGQEDTFGLERFRKAVNLRNSFAHNQYPPADLYPMVVRQVQMETTPMNPANNRKVAERLVGLLSELYRPWLDYLSSL